MRPAIFLILATALCAQDRAPLAQLAAEWLDSQFRKYDLNADGRLSTDEMKPVAAYVDGADANGDGAITLDELRAHFARKGTALQAAAKRALASASASGIEQRFKQLDRNGDGKLAGDELAQARWLKNLDRNADGAVMLDEAQSFFAAIERTPPPTANAPAPYKPEAESPRQEPRRIAAREAGIGRMIPDATFKTLDGRQVRLSDVAGKATVIALVSADCPVSKRYLPSLDAIEPQWKGRGITLLRVAPADAPAALHASVSTEVFVLDAKRTLIYRGALDDQYGLGYSLDAPRHRYAADALDAALAGRVPAVQATEAPGCVLDLGVSGKPAKSDIAYHREISRILQANCVECHRAGGVAPFALESYDQVLAKAGMIRRMVERQLMPPWFAAPPEKGAHTPWINDRSLSERDRADLLAWLANGKPPGDDRDAPLARTWPADWQIGTPDAVFQIPKPIEVKATGTMPYQMASVATGLTEDKWIEAFEVKPTAREVVHHVLVFVRGAGALAGRRIANDDEGGGFFAAYVPGNDHVIFPAGFAKSLPAGATLVFQIHYTPNGTAVKEQVKLGVRFAKSAPGHVVRVAGISNHRMSIPPGADDHPETASIPIPRDVVVLGFMPHMHLRGKSFRYDLITPDGTERTLLEVPRYDFNWQLAYRYAEPITVRAGSKLRATGWFDNSAANPANPDPDKTVRWGPQTTDEMMLGYVEYYVPGEDAKVAWR